MCKAICGVAMDREGLLSTKIFILLILRKEVSLGTTILSGSADHFTPTPNKDLFWPNRYVLLEYYAVNKLLLDMHEYAKSSKVASKASFCTTTS